MLASCYYHSLKLAMEKGIKRIAFPSISTGVYGFPVKLAAHIAVNVVARFEQEFPKQIEEYILFCLTEIQKQHMKKKLISYIKWSNR